MAFERDDVKRAYDFGKLMAKYVKFHDLPVSDLIEVSRHFVWFNQLAKKIEDHVLEIVKVKNNTPPEGEAAAPEVTEKVE